MPPLKDIIPIVISMHKMPPLKDIIPIVISIIIVVADQFTKCKK